VPPAPSPPPGPPAPPALVGEWKIGVVLAGSAVRSERLKSTREGLDLAVDQVNARGGARGRRLTLAYLDLPRPSRESDRAVQAFLDEQRPAVLLGEDGQGWPSAKRAALPAIATLNSSFLQGTGNDLFRACMVDERQAEGAALFAVRTRKATRVAVLFAADNMASSSLARWFAAQAGHLGAQVVSARSVGGSGGSVSELSAALEEARKKAADLVYIPFPPRALAVAVKAARGLGFSAEQILGSPGWASPDSVDDLAADLEGVAFTEHFAADAPWPAARAFTAAYRARYGHDPAPPAATAHDAVLILADALGRAAGDGTEAIVAALGATQGLFGATGALGFDAERDLDKEILVARVQSGKAVFETSVRVVDPVGFAPPLGR
jgi:branched-chain amino acid transport system substrate-binding protein